MIFDGRFFKVGGILNIIFIFMFDDLLWMGFKSLNNFMVMMLLYSMVIFGIWSWRMVFEGDFFKCCGGGILNRVIFIFEFFVWF